MAEPAGTVPEKDTMAEPAATVPEKDTMTEPAATVPEKGTNKGHTGDFPVCPFGLSDEMFTVYVR